MKKTILNTILLTILLASITYAQQNLFLIDFTIDKNDEINVERFFATDGNPRSNDLRSEYSAKMYAGEKLLYFTDFFVDFEIDDSDNELEQTYITLRFPSNRLADKIIISKGDVTLKTILLEDYLCKKDDICNPNCSAEQDVDCREKETEKILEETEKSNSLSIIITSTFILIIIIFIILEHRRLKYQKELNEKYKQ
ncbi:hypothetical protein CMO94_01460 [Candidatus Woesearchaeota archaeon]|jgi:hypothetical protein|nr:hypothetical protein [Candidatus Woesearchaeota archaeon]